MKEINLSKLPKYITGLRKDGNKDRRYKRGNTIIEIEGYMGSISGVANSQSQTKT